MTRATMAVIFFCVSACTSREGTATSTSSAPDSVVLQRTACLGTCPVYRLSVTKLGRIAFVDDNIDTTDTFSPQQFAQLSEAFNRLSFLTLPDSVLHRADYCTPAGSDSPSAILTVFAGAKEKSVNDYHGCSGTTDSTKGVLRRLRLLENQVDSVARAGRWITPSRRR